MFETNKPIIREENETSADFCHRLYASYGLKHLGLSYNYVKDGETFFSKRVPYEMLMFMGTGSEEKIVGMCDSPKTFFEKVQHRTIGDIEIMIDIDNNSIGKVIFKNIKCKAEWVCMKLKQEKYKIAVYKANTGYHIGFTQDFLRGFSECERLIFKEKLITRFGGDPLKRSEHNMIALEGSIHWKSGKKKSLIEV